MTTKIAKNLVLDMFIMEYITKTEYYEILNRIRFEEGELTKEEYKETQIKALNSKLFDR